MGQNVSGWNIILTMLTRFRPNYQQPFERNRNKIGTDRLQEFPSEETAAPLGNFPRPLPWSPQWKSPSPASSPSAATIPPHSHRASRPAASQPQKEAPGPRKVNARYPDTFSKFRWKQPDSYRVWLPPANVGLTSRLRPATALGLRVEPLTSRGVAGRSMGVACRGRSLGPVCGPRLSVSRDWSYQSGSCAVAVATCSVDRPLDIPSPPAGWPRQSARPAIAQHYTRVSFNITLASFRFPTPTIVGFAALMCECPGVIIKTSFSHTFQFY